MKKTPQNLEEAVELLLAQMTATDRALYKQEPEAYPGIRFHFSSGMALRNDWGLWHGKTGISRFLRKHRIYHGDDQGCVILRALWRRLHNLPIDDGWLGWQAKQFEGFWNRSGLTWDQKPLPGFKGPSTVTFWVDKRGKIVYE